MAYFEKRGTKTRAQVIIDGKKLSKSFKARKDAEMWATAQERRRDLGEVIELPSHDTLASVIDQYKGTWGHDKEWHLQQLRDGGLGNLALSKLNRARIVDYVVGLKTSPWLAKNRVSYLGSALKFAKYELKLTVRTQELEEAREELALRKITGRSNSRTRITDQDEIDLIAANAGDRVNSIDFAEILQVLAVLPIRVGELLEIKWTDIDHKNRNVTLRQRKHPDPKVKERNDEVIPLVKVGDLDTFDMVVTNRARYGNQEGPFPYTVNQASNAMDEARKRAGVNDGSRLNVHDLRAHAISKMLKAKINPMTIMLISGHKNPVVFFKHYVRLTTDDVRREVEQAMMTALVAA